MAGTYTQPSHERVVAQALTFLTTSRVPSAVTHGKSFLPPTLLQDYFTPERLRAILAIVLNEHDEDCGETAWKILHGDFLLVFLILLEIKEARFIKVFLRDTTLSDHALPYSRDRQLPGLDNVKQFCDVQRMYKTERFQPHMDWDLNAETILPIVKIENIRENENIYVDLIKLHPDFDGLEEYPDSRHPHRYIVKSFLGAKGERQFHREVDGYRKAQNAGMPITSLVRFYGCYSYRDRYHMVLQYADGGTLDDFYKATDTRPERANDILDFWHSQLDVVQAIDRLHKSGGCHQDITPSNLVRKSLVRRSTYASTTKLIDFNRSSFKVRQGMEARDMYGSQDFGAPETFRRDDYEQSTRLGYPQAADIWSLACVWLDAAVWLTEGEAGRDRFRRSREAEARRLDVDMGGAACFHDSGKMLNSVREKLMQVQSSLAEEDIITEMVCQRLITNMLDEDASLRPNSGQLWKETQSVLHAADREFEKIHGYERSGPAKGIRRVETAPIPSSSARQPQYTAVAVETPKKMTYDMPGEQGSPSSGRAERRHLSNPTSAIDTTHALHSVLQQAAQINSEHTSRALDPGTGKGRQTTLPDRTTKSRDEPSRHRFHGISRATSRTTAGDSTYGSAVFAAGTEHGVGEGTEKSPHRRGDSVMSPPHIESPPAYEKSKQPIPDLSVANASNWKNAKMRGESAELPYGRELKAQINNRDHMFILDNAYSTAPHWKSIQGTFEILSYLVEDCDPDGVELRFTNSDDRYGSRKSSILVENVKNVSPQGNTDLEPLLRSILKEYEGRLSGATFVRPLSIYVLTDGIWARGDLHPAEPILALVQVLKDLGLTRSQVGIQFISFGNNAEGLQRMRDLDNMRDLFGLPKDIVDTEPSNGNVWKMLLGAIDPVFDEAG